MNSFILLILCLTIPVISFLCIILSNYIYQNHLLKNKKRFAIKKNIKVSNKELSKSQKKIYKILNEEVKFNDVLPGNSLVNKLKFKEYTSISYLSSTKHENYINYSAIKALENNSIFRNFIYMQSISSGEDIEEVFTNDIVSYQDGSIKIHKVSKKCDIKIPFSPLTFSLSINSDIESISNLKTFGSKVGETYAYYENNIFIAMLNSFIGTEYIDNIEDFPSVYRGCYNLIKKGCKNLHLILPRTYTSMYRILKEEIQKEFNSVSISASYVSDLALFSQEVRAIILDKNMNLKVLGFQKGSISSSIISAEEINYIQTCLSVGFAMSGLANTCICKYDIDKKLDIGDIKI